jgi:lipopolysaccharide biosynthesis glycosyltransferase
MPDTGASHATREIVVVSGCDDAYAMPLGVAIRSALDQLPAHRRMRLFILDGGMSTDSRALLADSWKDPRIAIEWLHPNVDLVRDLPVSDHISIAAYLRLLMPELLPADVTRVIYMDADMMVRRDLCDLWDEPQGHHAVLAVQDLAAPYLDAANSMANFEKCYRRLAAAWPVANYRELGLPVDGKYFNSGLLVVDLEQWRRDGIAGQVLDCLRTHRQHVLWWDQYALNVVLARRWRALDHRWNQGAHIYVYPHWTESPVDKETFHRVRKAPWIVHFCSPTKPWHYFCRHPFTSQWRRYLRKTAWKNWRPLRPERFLNKWWDFHYQPLRSEWKSRVRALKRAIGYKRNRAA